MLVLLCMCLCSWAYLEHAYAVSLSSHGLWQSRTGLEEYKFTGSRFRVVHSQSESVLTDPYPRGHWHSAVHSSPMHVLVMQKFDSQPIGRSSGYERMDTREWTKNSAP